MNNEKKRARGDEFASRLSNYAGSVIAAIRSLPDTRGARLVADQLLRSSTAPGAHYAEARGAQSRRDFVHKVSLALKEMRESVHWLEVARAAGWDVVGFDQIRKEAESLTRMLSASKHTAQSAGDG